MTKEDLAFIAECDAKKNEMQLVLENTKKAFKRSFLADSRHIRTKEYLRRETKLNAEIENIDRICADSFKKDAERKRKILAKISELPPDERKVIEMRYRDGKDWIYIELEMNYSRSNVFRIHDRALKHLNIL